MTVHWYPVPFRQFGLGAIALVLGRVPKRFWYTFVDAQGPSVFDFQDWCTTGVTGTWLTLGCGGTRPHFIYLDYECPWACRGHHRR